MVLTIDALKVGAASPALATLDVSGNFRSTQDASISLWSIGSLGTGNAGLVYAGLPANAAALSQAARGSSMINAAKGQPVQFGDSGVVGLQYSQSSLVGNLTLCGGLDANVYNQTLTLTNAGLASNTGQALVFGSFANGRVALDTRGAPLTLSSNGAPGLVVGTNGSLNMNVVSLNNLAVGPVTLTPGNNCLLLQGNCVAINQPNPLPGYSFDCLGNLHVGSGVVRVEGGGLSIGSPGTLSIDSAGVPGGRLTVDNTGKTSVGGTLQVSGPVALASQLNMTPGQIISLNGDTNHTLGFDPTFDGPRLQGFAGGTLGTSQSTANAVSWTSNSVASYLPFAVNAPLTVLANGTVISPDPYLALARTAGNPDCVLAPASTVNLHSNAAVIGDVVLKNRNGGNVLIQSSNTGPGLYINSNNAVGIQTASINPLTAFDVAGAIHAGADNKGSRLINLNGKTFYGTLPTYRQVAVFYPSNNAGNGALLTIRGPCGSWTGSRGELKMTVGTAGSAVATAEWTGGIGAGVDVQVWNNAGVAAVWVAITTAYAMYNFDVVYGGQGYTLLAQPESTAAPTGSLIYSAIFNACMVSNTSTVTVGSLVANVSSAQSNVGYLIAQTAAIGILNANACNVGSLVSQTGAMVLLNANVCNVGSLVSQTGAIGLLNANVCNAGSLVSQTGAIGALAANMGSFGNIAVNTSSPLFLNHTMPQATDTPATNPDATNTLMVYEDCSGSTLSAGTLGGNAIFASNNCVQLTQAVNNSSGSLNYNLNPGTAFEVTVDMYVNAPNSVNADAMSFYVYCNTPNPGIYGGGNGYTISFDEYASSPAQYPYPYTASLWWNGTLLASQTKNTFPVPLNTWTQVRMTFVRNTWRVWYGKQLIFLFQDVSRNLVGSSTMNMGFCAGCGGSNAGHCVRNIIISKYTQGYWRPASNAAAIVYNGNVGISQPNPAYSLDVVGSARFQMNSGLQGPFMNVGSYNAGDWITSFYGSISDRYGIGQYNNGIMRVFASAYYNQAQVTLGFASSDSTGPAGTFNDVVGITQTAINMNQPVQQNAPINLKGWPILIAGYGDTNHRLVYDGTVDGPALSGYSGGALRSINSNVTVMSWNSSGCQFNWSSYYPTTQTWLRMGSGVAGKDGVAGVIAYQAFGQNNALDLVGAGASGTQRNVRIYDALAINANPLGGAALNVGGMTYMNNGGTLAQFGSGVGSQVTFAFNQGGYAHTIKTRHNSGAANNNSIDFYPWQPSDGQNNSPNNLMFSVTATGVGVLNSNPSYPLDVNGGMRVVTAGSSISTTVVNVPSGIQMSLAGPGNSYGPIVSLVGNGVNGATVGVSFATFPRPTPAGTILCVDDGNVSSPMIFSVAPSGNSNNAAVERLRIATSGLVGVNNNNPNFQLDVNGTFRCGAFTSDTSPGASSQEVHRVANVSYALGQQNTTVTSSGTAPSSYFMNTDYNYPSQAGPYPGGRMAVNDANFSTDFRWSTKIPGGAGNGFVERLTLTATGNVGINSPNPAYPLDVNGSACLRSSVVQPTWKASFYKQTTNSAQTSGGWIPTSYTQFTLQSGPTNTNINTTFQTNYDNTAPTPGVPCAGWSLNFAGIWTIQWSSYFAQSQNKSYLCLYTRDYYNVYDQNMALGPSMTTGAGPVTSSYTGYFNSGAQVQIAAYSFGNNQVYGGYVSFVLNQQTQ